ncbi:response regulator transcription factor [Geobacter sp. FeAm09]|nr:response regulator transcription factor [Geobacter sp. FeAm09]
MVVDDHAVVREGLSKLINHENDMVVCCDAEDGPSALKAIAAHKPDLAIVDISLAASSGLDVTKNIKIHYPEIPVLVLSMHEEALFAERALRVGASGYVMKVEPPATLIHAIRRVLSGKTFLSERMTEYFLSQVVHPSTTKKESPIHGLTDREFEVFLMIGKGLATRQIAERINLSVKTIDAYRENLKKKLNLKNAAELLQYAIEWSRNDDV